MLPQGYKWGDPENDGEMAERLASTEINVMSNRDVATVILDDYGDVAGVLLAAHDKTGFTFDVVVAKKHRRMGLGKILIKAGLDMYKDLVDVYGNDYEIELDVINPGLIKTLAEFGLEIKQKLRGGRVIMAYKSDTLAESALSCAGGGIAVKYELVPAGRSAAKSTKPIPWGSLYKTNDGLTFAQWLERLRKHGKF